jgi:hypothetical protein
MKFAVTYTYTTKGIIEAKDLKEACKKAESNACKKKIIVQSVTPIKK